MCVCVGGGEVFIFIPLSECKSNLTIGQVRLRMRQGPSGLLSVPPWFGGK